MKIVDFVFAKDVHDAVYDTTGEYDSRLSKLSSANRVKYWTKEDGRLTVHIVPWTRQVLPKFMPLFWDWYFSNEVELCKEQNVAYFDLETRDTDPTLDLSKKQVISAVFIDEHDNRYKFTEDDEEMLLWKVYKLFENYDFLVGYNSQNFDFPLLIERGKKYDLNFSQFSWKHGDLFQIMKKFNNINIILSTSNLTSFSLDSLGEAFLGLKKLDIGRKGAGGIWKLFNENRQKLQDYNEQDVLILKKLCEKFDLMSTLRTMSELTRVPMQTISRSIGACVEYVVIEEILKRPIADRQRLYEILEKNAKKDKIAYEGALVLIKHEDGGLFENLACYDFKALYPNILRTFNVSFETLDEFTDNELDNLTDEVHIRALVSKPKGVLARISDRLQEHRDKYKASGEKTKEVSVKLINNSLYGYFGGQYSILRDVKVASTITRFARYLLTYMSTNFDGYYNDTDSSYIKVAFEDRYKLEKLMNDQLRNHFSYIDYYTLWFDYNYYFTRWLSLCNNKYIGLKVDKKDEDVSKAKIWGKGIELVRSDFTKYGKRLLTDIINHILIDRYDLEKIERFLWSEKKLFFKSKVPKEELILIQTLSKMPDEYKNKGAHVRVAEKMFASGETPFVGQKIAFIITGRDSKKKLVGDFVETGKPDYEIYWKQKIFPTIGRVIECAYKGDRRILSVLKSLKSSELLSQKSLLDWAKSK